MLPLAFKSYTVVENKWATFTFSFITLGFAALSVIMVLVMLQKISATYIVVPIAAMVFISPVIVLASHLSNGPDALEGYTQEAGNTIFTLEGIYINNTFIAYENIKSVNVYFSGYKGMILNQRTLSRHTGFGNFIELTTMRSKNNGIGIYLDDEDEAFNLRSALLLLYTRHIPVKESTKQGTTYGLEFLSYPQIQEFKQKYKL